MLQIRRGKICGLGLKGVRKPRELEGETRGSSRERRRPGFRLRLLQALGRVFEGEHLVARVLSALSRDYMSESLEGGEGDKVPLVISR